MLGLLFMVISGSVMLYANLLPLTDLHETSFVIKQQMRKARELSVNGHNNASHGIYIERNQGTLVLYQGDSYLARDSAQDKSTTIGSVMNIESTFDLDDVNFVKWTGMPNKVGEITLTHKNAGIAVIDLNRIGVVNMNTKTVN